MSLADYLKNRLEMYCFLKDPGPKVPYMPANIYIEPTNVCNLNCVLCARETLRREKGILKLADFKRIIDQFASCNWYAPVTLVGNGEPTMNKAIIPMIEYAKHKGFYVSMISNSTLLDEERTERILHSGLDRYQTMFDSLDRTSYEKLRTGASYDKVKKNIISLIRRNEELGHPVFISIGLVDTSLTKNKKETEAYWRSLSIDNFYRAPLLSFATDSGLYAEAMKIKKGKRSGKCSAAFTDIFICWNGDVKLCPVDFNDHWIVGHIFRSSIAEIWNGSRAQRMRKMNLISGSLTRPPHLANIQRVAAGIRHRTTPVTRMKISSQ